MIMNTEQNSQNIKDRNDGNTVLYAVSRNYLNSGDWIETNDGTFAKVEKLEYREVYTDKGVIKKLDIKQVYVPANGV
jgi:hypothetical protein